MAEEEKIKRGLFGRLFRKEDAADAGELEVAEADVEPELSPQLVEDSPQPTAAADGGEPEVVTAVDEASVSEAEADLVSLEEPGLAAEEAVAEQQDAEQAEPERRRGLLARVFGRREEEPADDAVAEETDAALTEAGFVAPEEAPEELLEEVPEEVAEETVEEIDADAADDQERRAGLLGRWFGKRMEEGGAEADAGEETETALPGEVAREDLLPPAGKPGQPPEDGLAQVEIAEPVAVAEPAASVEVAEVADAGDVDAGDVDAEEPEEGAGLLRRWFGKREEAAETEEPPAAAQSEAESEAELEAEPETEPAPEPEAGAELEAEPELVESQAEGRGLFGRLRSGLAKTRQGLVQKVDRALFGKKEIDEETLEELEEALVTADMGVRTSLRLIEEIQEKVSRKELTSPEALREHLRTQIENILVADEGHFELGEQRPHVVMVVGVNGVGKTTTIGKIASQYRARGHKVLLAAGDTFRAAAIEQLEIWGQRVEAQVVRHQDGSDPAAVAFDAVEAGKARGVDLVIVDTAGRLHTKSNLMEELKKVQRVMDKALPGAPHEVLLVLDATTGQNAINQAKIFHEAVGVDGIALTKLDGTAKGGVIVGICDELKVPVQFIGIGEQVEDLRPFDATEFVEALF